jgi:hypothetical protein
VSRCPRGVDSYGSDPHRLVVDLASDHLHHCRVSGPSLSLLALRRVLRRFAGGSVSAGAHCLALITVADSVTSLGVRRHAVSCLPMLGFKSTVSAKRYSQSHGELHNCRRCRSRMCHYVPAATRRSQDAPNSHSPRHPGSGMDEMLPRPQPRTNCEGPKPDRTACLPHCRKHYVWPADSRDAPLQSPRYGRGTRVGSIRSAVQRDRSATAIAGRSAGRWHASTISARGACHGSSPGTGCCSGKQASINLNRPYARRWGPRMACE